jgi:LPXTG-site transpeptidase (sortase) family protein
VRSIHDVPRRHVGAALAVGGAVLLTFAAGRYAAGAMRADAARSAWDAAQAKQAVAKARAVAWNPERTVALVTGAPVAHLLIPRIGLDAIVLEGVDGDELNADPGHVPGSALPGEPGNAVISAHRDRHFSHFGELQLGDTVTTETLGRRTQWVIVARRVIDKDAPALFRTTDPTLTLTTCWPIRYLGSAPDRLILTAKPLVRTRVD